MNKNWRDLEPVNNFTRAYAAKGAIPYQPEDSAETQSAWDACLFAKFAPGQYNAPIVSGMSVSPFPTITAHTAGTENKADLFGSGQQLMGTQDYLLIAHCPILTSFYGAGGAS